MKHINLFIFIICIPISEVLAQQHNLSINVTSSNSITEIGDTTSFFITVRNEGQTNVSGLVVKTELGADLLFLNAEAPGTTNYENATGNWNINEALLSTIDSIVLTLKVVTGAPGVHLLASEVLAMDQEDINSIPNNNDFGEDDWAIACLSTPYEIFPGQNDTIILSSPPNLSGHGWYLVDGAAEVFISSDSFLNITQAGTYQFYADQSGCETGVCCPIIVKEGFYCNIQILSAFPEFCTGINNLATWELEIAWDSLPVGDSVRIAFNGIILQSIPSYQNPAYISIDGIITDGINTDTIQVFVSSYQGCLDEIILLRPAPYACNLEVTFGNIQYQNNGTLQDPTDDTITFEVNATNPSGSALGWSGGGQGGNYDLPVTYGPYSISLPQISFLIQDMETDDCTQLVMIDLNFDIGPDFCAGCAEEMEATWQ